jgi:hypothetical protein
MSVPETAVPAVLHSGEKNIFHMAVLMEVTEGKAETFFWLETSARIHCLIFHFSSTNMRNTE